jgi:hypothetical protein
LRNSRVGCIDKSEVALVPNHRAKTAFWESKAKTQTSTCINVSAEWKAVYCHVEAVSETEG